MGWNTPFAAEKNVYYFQITFYKGARSGNLRISLGYYAVGKQQHPTIVRKDGYFKNKAHSFFQVRLQKEERYGRGDCRGGRFIESRHSDYGAHRRILLQ